MKITQATWMFLDTETTGLKPEEGAQVIEFGAVFIDRMRIQESYDFLINPGKPIPPRITQVTGISDKDVEKQRNFEQVAPALMRNFQQADFVAAYNKDFDRKMLEHEFKRVGMKMPDLIWLDPLTWSRHFETADLDKRLGQVADRFKVKLQNAHRADADAVAGAEILIKFFEWGIDEAAFPDDVEQLKEMERGWRKQFQARSRIMNPLRQPATDPRTGLQTKRVTTTGEPGKVAQDVFDHRIREEFSRQGAEWMYRLLREKWGRVK